MKLRTFNVGCFGGGTGLPSLLGGLKTNPWLTVNAVVTMFDSGGSSGVLRDQLGVLPPGDVLKCALALARNEREARRVLLARLPTIEHHRLGGHTGGNLLLSMMQQYSGDFLAAVDGLRALLGCAGRVWPVSVEQASVCAEYRDGTRTSGEFEVDAAQRAGRDVARLWLEPEVKILPAAAEAIAHFDAAVIGPGSFYTSLMPIFLVNGAPDAIRRMPGPIVLVANLLTEGRGMMNFTAATAVRLLGDAIGRPVDVVLITPRVRRLRSSSGTPPNTRRRSRWGTSPRAAMSSAATSGAVTSRGTIAAASRRRSGRCLPGVLCRLAVRSLGCGRQLAVSVSRSA